jgi:DNA-binding response OmpR family regulator
MRKKSVLVIEDDPSVAGVVKAMVEDHDYHGLTADSPQEGLETAKRERPDIILLDLMLPGMSGLGVLRELKRNPELAAIPVVVFTGMGGDDAVVNEARDLGAVGFLTKNCNWAELIAMLGKISSYQSAHPELLAGKKTSERPPAFSVREDRPSQFLWLTPAVRPKPKTWLP